MSRLMDPLVLRTVSQAVLCELLSISTTTCNKLERSGVLIKKTRGCYDAIESVHVFLRYWVKDHGHETTRSKLVAEQVRRLELQNQVTEGNLISIDEASQVMTQYANALRSALMTLPARVVNDLSTTSKRATIQAVLTSEINEFLTDCETFFSELPRERDLTVVEDPTASPASDPRFKLEDGRQN